MAGCHDRGLHTVTHSRWGRLRRTEKGKFPVQGQKLRCLSENDEEQ